MARKPFLQSTTLWDFPSQNYAGPPQGDINFTGATPSYVIWNCIQKYTLPNDLVIDPFCGSGTMPDVARETNRQARGYDIAPRRPDITYASADKIPLGSGKAALVFMDPPYSDHINYSDNPRCIGKLSAFSPEYFTRMEKAIKEAHRVLKHNGYLALYVCDFFKVRRGFAPVGFKLFSISEKIFTPVDIITVTRHNKDLQKGNYHKAAVKENFYLRGFNYLFIFQKN